MAICLWPIREHGDEKMMSLFLKGTVTDRPLGTPLHEGHCTKTHVRYINGHLLTDCWPSLAQDDQDDQDDGLGVQSRAPKVIFRFGLRVVKGI